jgi:site-specific DNA-cytosine methylase
MVDDNEAEEAVLTAKPNQQYVVDDMFCGASGASCGIRQAGFRIGLACDSDVAAGNSYRVNFPEARFKQMNLADLIDELEHTTEHADIVHLSPPCQVFSPAHTRAGRNDSANVAALYLCKEYLRRRCPRISTGEQTFGLLFDRNQEFFTALVGQYTALGYSFSWDLLRLKQFGVPSIRRRLIWIASCPGEALPPFPSPTNDKYGLPPAVTLREAFKGIEPESSRDPLHNVQQMLTKARASVSFEGKPYDDRTQVGTVTTQGSVMCHPSGRRAFTLRELACIQSFPKKHKFLGTFTQINRQIGNAFPPSVVKILYQSLRTWLLEQDHVLPFKPGIVVIPVDDDDDNDEEVVEIAPPTESGSHGTGSSDEEVIEIEPPSGFENDSFGSHDDEVAEIPPPSIVFVDNNGTRNPVEDTIVLDDSDADSDVVMLNRLSRSSSRTMSVESLRSLIEIDMTIDERISSGSGQVIDRHIELHSRSQRTSNPGYKVPKKRRRLGGWVGWAAGAPFPFHTYLFLAALVAVLRTMRSRKVLRETETHVE